MFGDPTSVDSRWEYCKLSDLANLKIGPFGSLLHKEDYVRSGHAIINPSHIVNGRIIPDPNQCITDSKYSDMEAYHLHKGDVVLGRRGEMGRCAVVYDEGLVCGTGSMIITSNGVLLPEILQRILSHPSYKNKIEEGSVGTTMLNLNVKIASSFIVPVLPINLQNQFMDFVRQVDKSKYYCFW